MANVRLRIGLDVWLTAWRKCVSDWSERWRQNRATEERIALLLWFMCAATRIGLKGLRAFCANGLRSRAEPA